MNLNVPHQSERERKSSQKTQDNATANAKLSTTAITSFQHISSYASSEEFFSIEEALRSPHVSQWLEALFIEMNSLNVNDI